VPASDFYRFFRDKVPDHVVWDDYRAAYRLASTLFKTAEVSVDDGEKCSAEDTAARNAPCGVAAVAKAQVADMKSGDFALEIRPDEEDGNPAHTLLVRPEGCRSKDKERFATLLRVASRVRIPYPGLTMVHGDGTPVA
jgi:hypothetical protein